MSKKSFRPDVVPATTWRGGLLQRLVLAGLLAQAITACHGSSLSETVAEKAHQAAAWGTCIVDNPPKASDLAHPSAMVDNWSACVEPARMTAGLMMIVPHTVPPPGPTPTAKEDP